MAISAKEQRIRLRSEIDQKDCWNTSVIYANRKAWQAAVETLQSHKNDTNIWPQLAPKNYRLDQPQSLLTLIEAVFDIERTLEKLYVFAHLTHDQDITNQEAIADLKTIVHLFTLFKEETSWIQPALIRLPQTSIQNLLASQELSKYRFYLEKIFRLAPHTKTPEEEKLLASLAPSMETAYKTFSSLSDSEIPFGSATDSQGNKHPLSHALASLYMQSSDRELRKTTYQQQLQRYADFRLSFSNLLNGKIQAHIFEAKARNYPSCLDAALYQNNISTNVFFNVIETTKQHTHLITQYLNLKKTVLNLPSIHFYDVYAPLSSEKEKCYTYDQAVNIICDSLNPLGKEYVHILKKGLTTDGWVDKYENLNKRSGAYSSGCHDTFPYILLNYTGTLYDISILAHEGGHSMHSYYSRTHQPFQYSSYPIFLAEIASTFNETLLMEFLLKQEPSHQEKIVLLTRFLDTIFATIFRQTMFASFEYEIHSSAEKGIPLTEQLLSSTYLKLQKQFYGDCITFDELSHMEWARIPHFYYNFYVYQYAIGMIASLCFAEMILSKNAQALEFYLSFLKSGGSDFPLNILKKSGLDIETPQPMAKAFSFIEKKIAELANLVEKTKN